MAVPNYYEMFRPLLLLAAKEGVTRRSASAAMCAHFKLTPQECLETIKSGQSVILSRTGWAMTYLTKGGLIEKSGPGTYMATDFGKKFLTEHPDTISLADLRKLPEWENAWQGPGSQIPGWQDLIRPTLDAACMRDITVESATLEVRERFNLSPEDCEQKMPQSGRLILRTRTGWALKNLYRAGLLEKVASGTYRATDLGRKTLLDYPNSISERDLYEIVHWPKTSLGPQPPDDDGGYGDDIGGSGGIRGGDATPTESIDNAITAIHADLKACLMHSVLQQSPTFFEKLVLDLLTAMGYGGSRADAARHLGRSGDEGIDGCINQDPLGLDQVLVQAKRYKPENPVGREAIQSFIGAMSGHGVNKGVFITTSYFNANAREFVKRGLTQKLILMDGDMLLALMLKHRVGVRVEKTLDLLALDQNYFEDEDE